MSEPTTLFDKIWADHEVADGLIYIDLHLVHEVTSAQAFDGLRLAGRPVRRPDRTVATADHNVPTDGTPVAARIKDELSRIQVQKLESNCAEFGIPVYSLGSEHQGIVHVIGPELGLTQPGMTIVCGDSHTATHGAFGALAFGIGTSEVEHVLATQTLVQRKPKSMRITYDGQHGPRRHRQGPDPRHDRPDGRRRRRRPRRRVRRAGDRGALDGGPHDDLQHDDRGRRPGGHDRPRRDDDRLRAGPRGRAGRRRLGCARRALGRAAHRRGRAPSTARSRSTSSAISPMVSWGTNPGMVVGVAGSVPEPAGDGDRRALEYMGLEAGTPIEEIKLDRVFIGSCTNSRIGDLRAAAEMIRGRRVADSVYAMVVPGSVQVKAQAEAEGLDRIFSDAGFDWRGAGCSMCLGMNPDILQPGERCASTSNRNFEGRQGRGGRTHLVSPQMAAAAAIEGRFVDIRDWS